MKHWIRTWVKIDLEEVAKKLLVIGVLNAECFSCHKIGISKESKVCPNCGANFKYVGFRKKVASSEIEKFSERGFILLDFEDFLKEFKRRKAKKIFNSS